MLDPVVALGSAVCTHAQHHRGIPPASVCVQRGMVQYRRSILDAPTIIGDRGRRRVCLSVCLVWSGRTLRNGDYARPRTSPRLSSHSATVAMGQAGTVLYVL